MIVKNESQIIERCLDNAKGIVDYISICDTGSTDNTIEIIESYLKKNNIKGKVFIHEWKNFGHNRTLSVKSAQKMLSEYGVNLSKAYLFLIDADMVLKISPQFSSSELHDDSYLIVQKSSNLSYSNIRLLRASLPWVCKGVTHEYWSCDIPHQKLKLNSLSIDDLEDGGSKSDKFERDLKLLTDGLKEEPDNERYMFYIAQTYKCLKRYDEAIHWYKARIQKGSWKEEVWYSKFMIGETYEEMGFWDHALHWYLDAFQYQPQRAEPLKKISGYYRNKGNNDLAYLFAKQGSQIPYPKDQLLFISHPVYDYQFDEDISISAYYTRYKNEGFDALNRLLLKKNIPQYVKEQAYKNLLFYVDNIKEATFIPISINLPYLKEGSTEKYYAMNPSIQKTQNGYSLICRTVNFSQKGGTEYKSRTEGDDTIRTRNYFVTMNKEFHILSQQEIVENLDREKIERPRVQGLEDCRLFYYKKDPYFLGTAFDVPPGSVMQTLCNVEQNPIEKELPVLSFIPLQGPISERCEKNWLPFVKDDHLLAFYSYDPLLILKLDELTGNCTTFVQKEQMQDFSKFRGSAGPISFDSGYLILIHEVIFTNQRTYTHRFVYLDKDFKVTKVSKPFTFMHKGIEYCCGMTVDHEDQNVILSVGIEDKDAYLCKIKKDSIQALLQILTVDERK